MRIADLVAVAPARRGRHRVPVDASACPAGWPPGCSPTTRPTTRSGVTASILDGLLLGCGDAVIGINPATDSPPARPSRCCTCVDEVIARATRSRPSPACSPTSRRRCELHGAGRAGGPGVPVDRRHAGGQRGFGVTLATCCARRTRRRCRSGRGTVGTNVHVLRDRPGQRARPTPTAADGGRPADAGGPRLRRRPALRPAAGQHRRRVHRAGVPLRRQADHCAPAWRTTSAASCSACPMGVDVCYTNHAEADADDTDALLLLLGVAGCSFVIGVPGADDVMLHYQSLSFSRRALRAAGAGAAAGAGVRGVAGADGPARARRPGARAARRRPRPRGR